MDRFSTETVKEIKRKKNDGFPEYTGGYGEYDRLVQFTPKYIKYIIKICLNKIDRKKLTKEQMYKLKQLQKEKFIISYHSWKNPPQYVGSDTFDDMTCYINYRVNQILHNWS